MAGCKPGLKKKMATITFWEIWNLMNRTNFRLFAHFIRANSLLKPVKFPKEFHTSSFLNRVTL